MTPTSRVVLVIFDGLRPDLVDPIGTPNIHRLQQQGVRLARQRTVYPSETRVAFTSLATGAFPDGHGIVGNSYLDRSGAEVRNIDLGDHRQVEAPDGAGRAQIGTASLGEALAQQGRTLAVLASNSTGAMRVLHHKARSLGHFTLSGHDRDAATATAELGLSFDGLTPFAGSESDLAAQIYLTDVFLETWPRLRPDVTVLSYSEPDHSSHYNGTGAAATRAALALVDAQFGRVLDWWDSEGQAEGVNLVLVSDHGHVTVHARADLAGALAAAGLRLGHEPGQAIDVVAMEGQVGALYLREPSEAMVRRAAAALQDAPWCGPIFTAPRSEAEGIAPGTLPRHLVRADHARTADILFAYRADDRRDSYGLIGGTWSPDAPLGCSVHGGLHPMELASFGVLAGPAFRGSFVTSTPTGIIDIAPTILHLLGIAAPPHMHGRVLHEALANGAVSQATESAEVWQAAAGGYRQALRRIRLGDAHYLDGGWAGDDSVALASAA